MFLARQLHTSSLKGRGRAVILGAIDHVPSARPRSISTQHESVLDTYWKARGVFDVAQRRRLLDVAQKLQTSNLLQHGGLAPLTTEEPLPGVPSTWALEEREPSEVLEVSRRLLQLYQMLGGGNSGSKGSMLSTEHDVPSVSGSDVAWMVTREPGLLTADFRHVARRLLEMKVAVASTGVDVPRVVVRQPALLLSDSWALDLAALQPRSGPTADTNEVKSGSASQMQVTGPSQRRANAGHSQSQGKAGSSQSTTDDNRRGLSQSNREEEEEESSHGEKGAPTGTDRQGSGSAAAAAQQQEEVDPVAEMLLAWEWGLSNDGLQEWSHRYRQLLDYIGNFGDTAVGYRDGDDPELARWVSKQRSEHRRGQLHQTRLQCLVDAGFEFDADQAEWTRWYKELEAYQKAQGNATPVPLTMGVDLYLINWCSVQRIARRSRVLSEQRIQALDRLGFDWSGADPLS
ncbi:hypothetical protein DUNSADRAFT_18433 [Dunaliella salina]|uniref:Helicase-associated domain-containing protein n=1 Tax=Dunaliella salina TaxID=3046 RepID=A0ABQ7G052_DUNSA|nr:hypothetical protein DUNSADRAFT_18433 [Dunaliella salina]|eukprot:KAF5827981.1 hypothetical protein DUNSADRAFT_18433 [Dunaliella salina]